MSKQQLLQQLAVDGDAWVAAADIRPTIVRSWQRRAVTHAEQRCGLAVLCCLLRLCCCNEGSGVLPLPVQGSQDWPAWEEAADLYLQLQVLGGWAPPSVLGTSAVCCCHTHIILCRWLLTVLCI